jgi:Domain of unknown function (DUF4442)
MDQPQSESAFFAIVRNPLKFRLYLLTNLPSAFFSGLRIAEADSDHCIVTVPYKWFTRNPFRSTYFACLCMAAEMSTGILAMAPIYKSKPAVSMLVVGMETQFTKKATGLTRFLCNDGPAICAAIAKARATGEAQTVKARSVGTSSNGDIVAEFSLTWSFKAKK